MTSIAPPGTDTSKWPKAMGAQQLAVRESAAKVKIANDNIEKNKQLINGITERYKAFFVAHFGIPPIDGIYKMYYQGKTVKQGGGPGNALAIAQEIMEYTNPSAAEYGLTKETVIGLTTAMCRFYDLYNIKQQADAEAQGFLEAAIFQLEYRPSAEAVQAFGKDLVSSLKAKIGKPGSNYYGFTSTVIKQHSVHSHIRLNAENILKYYGKAYSRTPSYFWEFTAKHRIYAEAHGALGDLVTIKVAEVDAATGALGRGNKYSVGTFNPTPGLTQDLVLAQFKEYMFPEMFLLSAGVVVDAQQRESLYADQLKSASNLWTGIPDKANTPYAVVLDQQFQYPKASGVVTQPGPTTSKPISMLSIYMQPTGIEEAMKKILDVNYPGNAIEQWFTKSYIAGVTASGKSLPYTTAVSPEEWSNRTKAVPAIMKSLYAVLNHPGLYRRGIAFIDEMINAAGQPDVGDVAMSFVMGDAKPQDKSSKTALEHVKLIMSYANWPTAQPQLLFQAPFDDQRDILTLTGLFNRYMNENHAVAPPSMYLPEAFNGRISARAAITIEGGSKSAVTRGSFALPGGKSTESVENTKHTFGFMKGSSYPMKRSRTYPLYQAGSTSVYVLYSRNAKTVLSKTPLADVTMSNLPMQIDARVIRQSDSPRAPTDMDQGASVAVAAVVTAGAVAATGPIGLVALPLVYGLTRMV